MMSVKGLRKCYIVTLDKTYIGGSNSKCQHMEGLNISFCDILAKNFALFMAKLQIRGTQQLLLVSDIFFPSMVATLICIQILSVSFIPTSTW